MNKLLLLFLIGITLLTACKGRKQSQNSFDRSEITTFNFVQLSMKSKLHFNDQKQNFDTQANIRMHKDSIIWISVNALLGIEAGRCMITKDSIRVINKLQKEYSAYSFQQINQQLNTSLSFELIQNLLVGNPILDSSLVKKSVNAQGIKLEQKIAEFLIENLINKNGRVAQINIQHQADKEQRFETNYKNYQTYDNGLFPNSIEINGKMKQEKETREINASIEHQKVDFSTSGLEFPFYVNNRYARKH